MTTDLGAKALWTLLPISAIFGLVSVLVFRTFSNQVSIRRSVNLVLAHVMELGLFLDSPGLVLGAQRDLLRENVRLLGLVIVPGGILATLFAIAFVPMNSFYGRAPLHIGDPSVVTVQLKNGPLPSVQLEPPAGIVVETPEVRVLRDNQISWRVRPLRTNSGTLRFHIENRVLQTGMHTIFWRDPAIRSIDVRYPRATILSFRWEAWFIIGSMISAVIFGLS
jgi:hypothetical protein